MSASSSSPCARVVGAAHGVCGRCAKSKGPTSSGKMGGFKLPQGETEPSAFHDAEAEDVHEKAREELCEESKRELT